MRVNRTSEADVIVVAGIRTSTVTAKSRPPNAIDDIDVADSAAAATTTFAVEVRAVTEATNVIEDIVDGDEVKAEVTTPRRLMNIQDKLV